MSRGEGYGLKFLDENRRDICESLCAAARLGGYEVEALGGDRFRAVKQFDAATEKGLRPSLYAAEFRPLLGKESGALFPGVEVWSAAGRCSFPMSPGWEPAFRDAIAAHLRAASPQIAPAEAVTESGFLRRRVAAAGGRSRWSFLQVGVREEELRALREADDERLRALAERVEKTMNLPSRSLCAVRDCGAAAGGHELEEYPGLCRPHAVGASARARGT